MGIKKLNPVTPGTRFKVALTFDELTTSKPHKKLTVSLKKSGGRNNQGKRTMRMIGGGHKRNYRLIDFKRDKHDVSANVLTIEYDPNRSSRIALVEYTDGEKRYIIAPQGLAVGQSIISGSKAAPEVGNSLFLRDIPLGTVIHNIEMAPGRGGAIARSAGSFAQLSARDGKHAVITLPSGETRKVLADCIATIGVVSNAEHNLVRSGKAGRSRWLGRRPRVRGVAMNPVDHPMGGGEGRQSGGHPRSRKGTPSKGYKTRHPKKPSSKLIIERRKK
ncbi:MAG: 50S ribosomal protein L2 [Flavobacteriales bacterium]|jgi:large subunit ribosomal protein L2